jgi:hypothetical protein
MRKKKNVNPEACAGTKHKGGNHDLHRGLRSNYVAYVAASESTVRVAEDSGPGILVSQ